MKTRSQQAIDVAANCPVGVASGTQVADVLAALSDVRESAPNYKDDNIPIVFQTVASMLAFPFANFNDRQAVKILGTGSVADGAGQFFSIDKTDTTSVQNTVTGVYVASDGTRLKRVNWFQVCVGTNAHSGDSSAFLSKRALVGVFPTGYHAFRDEDTYSASDVGFNAKSSFDSIYTASGSTNWNHLRSYQARIQYNGSGVCDEIAGYHSQLTHNGTGVVTNNIGLMIKDALGTGPIDSTYGIYVDPLTRGTTRYAFYSAGDSPSYFGGSIQSGGSFVAAPVQATNIASVSGIRVNNTTGAGIVTTQYGIEIADLTKGGTNYAIWSPGSASSYFGGHLRADGGFAVGGAKGNSPMRVVGLPTSNAGLVSGELYNDGGTVKVA